MALTTSEESPSYVPGALNESFAPKLVTETFPDLDFTHYRPAGRARQCDITQAQAARTAHFRELEGEDATGFCNR